MSQVPTVTGPRVNLGGLPNLSFATPGGGIAPDVRLSAPQIAPMAFQTPQFNMPRLSTPQFSAPQLRAYEPNPSSLRSYEVSDHGAQQLQQEGSNLQGAGEELGRVAMAMQAKVNATVVDDALDQARQAALKLTWGQKDPQSGNVVGGYRNLKGEDAFRRPNEMGLDDEVGQSFQDTVKTIIDGKITNPLQRQAFDHQVAEIGLQLRQGAMLHQAEQFDAYHDQVYKSMAENQVAEFATLDPRDKNAQQTSLDKLDQTVATRLISQGMPLDAVLVEQRKARSGAVTGLFEKALADKNYAQAQALLNTWAGAGPDGRPIIDPDAAAKMKLSIDGHVAQSTGMAVADDVYSHAAAPAFNAPDTTRMFNVMAKGIESPTGQVGKDGKLATDGLGSYGAAQLQESTALATAKAHPELVRLAGAKTPQELVDLSKRTDKIGEAANLILGQAHYNDLVGQFKGDIYKAAAAYNAGEAWLVGGKDRHGNPIRGALKEAAEKGGDWLDYVPASTKDYVLKAKAIYASGEGAPALPNKNDLYAKVDAQTTDPDARRAGYARIDQRWTADEQAKKQGEELATQEGIRRVWATGGDTNSITPELMSRIPPDKLKEIAGAAKDLRDGKFVTTDNAVYATVMDPEVSRHMTLPQLEGYRTRLSEPDFNKARQLWQDQHAPQPDKSPSSLDVTTVDKIVENRLQFYGINPSPNVQSQEDRNRMAMIKSFVHDYVLHQQQTAGKKFETYGDLETVVNNMFLKEQRFRRNILGVDVARGADRVLTMRGRDIATDVRDDIVKGYRQKFGREPSEAEQLQEYFRRKFYK